MDEEYLDFGFMSEDQIDELVNATSDTSNHNENVQENENVENNNVIEEESKEIPESVDDNEGNNQENENGTSDNTDAGSPSSYSSIAKALKAAGVIQTLDDDYLDKIESVADFADAFAKDKYNSQSDMNKRVLDALNYKMEPSRIQQYEKTLETLSNVGDDVLESDEQAAVEFRKRVIFQDYKNKGYSDDKAIKMVNRSFKEGNDIEDAKDAKEACLEYYKTQYAKEIDTARQKQLEDDEKIKSTSKQLADSIMNDDNVFKSLGVSEIMRNKIVSAVSKPIKNKDGSITTEINEYAKKNPVDFYKYLGLFYTMTDGFTNIDSLISEPVQRKNKKNLEDLEKALKRSVRPSTGNPKIVSGVDDKTGLIDWSNMDFDLAPPEF